MDSAFSTPDNHPRLDHYFAILLQHTLLAEELLQQGSTQTEMLEPFFELLAGVRALTIPEDTKVKPSLSNIQPAN